MIKVFIGLLWIMATSPLSYRHLSKFFANVIVLSMESTIDLITNNIVV
jgi:hypothetical protein